MFLSACAEAGALDVPSETFPQAITLCKHQSEEINYAGREKKKMETDEAEKRRDHIDETLKSP